MMSRELTRLGVSPAVISVALIGFDSEGNAYRAAASLAARIADGDYHSFRKKIWAHLQRRGLESEVIRDTVSRLWRELTNPMEGGVGPDEDE